MHGRDEGSSHHGMPWSRKPSHIAYDPSTDAPLSPIVVTDALGMINKADGMMQMCMKGACGRGGGASLAVFWIVLAVLAPALLATASRCRNSGSRRPDRPGGACQHLWRR